MSRAAVWDWQYGTDLMLARRQVPTLSVGGHVHLFHPRSHLEAQCPAGKVLARAHRRAHIRSAERADGSADDGGADEG